MMESRTSVWPNLLGSRARFLRKKASLLVLAERDLRSREAVQIKSDLSAIYEVLERYRRDREPRLALRVR
jgi:hypothetical protein